MRKDITIVYQECKAQASIFSSNPQFSIFALFGANYFCLKKYLNVQGIEFSNNRFLKVLEQHGDFFALSKNDYDLFASNETAQLIVKDMRHGLVSFLTPGEMGMLVLEFESMDANKNGLITMEEVLQFVKLSEEEKQAQVKQVFEQRKAIATSSVQAIEQEMNVAMEHHLLMLQKRLADMELHNKKDGGIGCDEYILMNAHYMINARRPTITLQCGNKEMQLRVLQDLDEVTISKGLEIGGYHNASMQIQGIQKTSDKFTFYPLLYNEKLEKHIICPSFLLHAKAGDVYQVVIKDKRQELVKNLTMEQIAKANQEFAAMDRDHNGHITQEECKLYFEAQAKARISELRSTFNKKIAHVTSKQAIALLEQQYETRRQNMLQVASFYVQSCMRDDLNQDGKISFAEYLAQFAAKEVKK